ncbi:hypothetical protein LZL87_009591 [Fusarium oxysporum]|nr:hypothetical protein LZL87_009591 [Fusarium oxysporum]
MPTSTEFFGVTAYNLGPLTTTFSAPSACATGTDHHVIVNASEPEIVWGYPTCGFQDRGSYGASLTQPLISFDVLTTPASTYLDDRLLTQSRYSSDFVVATWVAAVPLIHQQSDIDEAEDDDNDDDDDENDGGDDGDGEDTDGNAGSTKNPGNGVVGVLGLTLGILAGMGMLL